MAGLTVEARRDGSVAVLRLRGEARLEEVDALRDAARGALEGGVRHLLLDVAGLGFADSASVGAILDAQGAAKRAGGGLALFGASRRLTRMLEGMGLGGQLPLAADEAAARKALGA